MVNMNYGSRYSVILSLYIDQKHWIMRVMLLLLAVVAVACGEEAKNISQAEYEAEVLQWRADRVESLRARDGYLNLSGLFWLQEGANTFGSDSSNSFVFPPQAPAFMGAYYKLGDSVRVEINDEVAALWDGQQVLEMTLTTDSAQEFTSDSLIWYLIKRGDKLGVRLRDLESPALEEFTGFEYFPIDLKWRLPADYHVYDPPKSVIINNILNIEEEHESPGYVTFDIDGKTYSLDIIRNSSGNFMIIADGTSTAETYGGGRYFYIDDPDENGKTIVDFNKAYNPVCAYKLYSTCQLPPPQNVLPIRIPAGEMDYAGTLP